MGGRAATVASPVVPKLQKVKDPITKRRAKPNVRKNGSSKTAVVKVRSQGAIELLEHPERVIDWDDEELDRGQRKDKNGRFTGRPPDMIPAVIHEERKRRQLDVLAREVVKAGLPALEALVSIYKNPKNDERARVAAAKVVLEHARGTPSSHSTVDHRVSAEPKFLKALEGAVISTDDDEDIIEAEIIE